MDALECILSRRSIRKYSNRVLPDDVIETLLKAAVAAPSAGNEQPWHFVVIREKETLKAIAGLHPYAEMLPSAQAAILVCADPSLEKYQGYMVQDCSASTENILLAAHAIGLGAVWVGVHPVAGRVAALQKLLGIPQHVLPLSLIPVGYPAEAKEASNRYDTGRIHQERW